jgi:hypothetical protein
MSSAHHRKHHGPPAAGRVLDEGARRDIVQACGTIEDCAQQLSHTLHELGGLESLPGIPSQHDVKAELDSHMAELDGKISQILDAVQRIGSDLRGDHLRRKSA